MTDNNKRIEVLHQNFRQSFAQKKITLEYLYNDLFEPDNDEAAEALSRFLHKLAGSSGMYGFSDISHCAGQALESGIAGNFKQQASYIKQLLVLLESSQISL